MAVGLFGTSALPVPDAVHLDPAAPVVIDAAGVSWAGVRLERLDAVFIHGFRYEDPVLPPADPACDWSLWQAGTVIRQQTYSTLYSIWARLEQLGGPRLYNPLSCEVAAFDRLGQLDRLARAGFPVPPVLAGNDDAAMAAFQRQYEGAGAGVVWRPVTGRAAWQLFRDRQRRHLVAVDRPPVLLAAVVPGRLLRAYVLDGRVVLVLATSGPSRDGLERLEAMAPVRDLPPSCLADIGRAVAGLGLRWAVVLVVVADDAEPPDATDPVFYDIDPDPELGDLPAVFETFLKRALAAALSGEPLPEPDFSDAPLERPALLLRRMLAIQFDIDQTKYAE